MKIIEATPITLPNAAADMVTAFVYMLAHEETPRVSINYPVTPRITDEFTNAEIDELWSSQYPAWNARIFA